MKITCKKNGFSNASELYYTWIFLVLYKNYILYIIPKHSYNWNTGKGIARNVGVFISSNETNKCM